MSTAALPSPLRLCAVGALLAAQLGCAKTIGDASANMTNAFVMPELMAGGDIGVGCASGEALGGLISSFAFASAKAEKGAVITGLSAAMCLDDVTWEAELDRIRAFRAGDVGLAEDAAARAQRAHYDAARRYLLAWDRLVSAYGVPEPGEACPKLKKEEDQLTYLLGLSSGLLAVTYDGATGGAAEVSLAIPAAVARGAACIDDATWWGVPSAMGATLGVLLPQDGVDPWADLDAAVAAGEAAGVRLASSFAAQAARTVGDRERLRAAIRGFAASHEARKPDADYAMLDAFAYALVRYESDRLWTEATGHRTPFGQLGTFPDDAPDTIDVDVDLFDDLLGPDASDTTP